MSAMSSYEDLTPLVLRTQGFFLPEQEGMSTEDLGEEVANADDFVNGQMKSVQFQGESILLSRVANQFYATAIKCTHYGAQLDKGVLNGDRVVCPWHGACFNVRTGDIEEGMVLEPLKTYRVHVVRGKVYVAEGKRRIAIIGGGAAAAAACEQIAKTGFDGVVDMYSAEDVLPYDRTKISKICQRGVLLRSQEFYDAHRINVFLNSKIEVLDGKEKSVTLRDGTKTYYDTFLIASGGLPRKLNIGEEGLLNVTTVRTHNDMEYLKSRLTPQSRLVIIGAGILGLEMASALKTSMKIEDITIVDSGKPNPEMRGLFGPKVFEAIRKIQTSNGVKFVRGPPTRFIVRDRVSDFEEVTEREIEDAVSTGLIPVESSDLLMKSEIRSASALEIKFGEQPDVEGDFFVICVGIVPNSKFIKNVPIQDDGTLLVDAFCRVVGTSEIYAAGDVSSITSPSNFVSPTMVIQHWGWAMQQGRIAARNMFGICSRFHCVPVFWTTQFGTNFRFCGGIVSVKPSSVRHSLIETLISLFKREKSDGKASAIVVGDSDSKFVIYYTTPDGQIEGVGSLASDPTVTACAELLRRKQMITVEELKEGLTPQVKLQRLQDEI